MIMFAIAMRMVTRLMRVSARLVCASRGSPIIATFGVRMNVRAWWVLTVTKVLALMIICLHEPELGRCHRRTDAHPGKDLSDCRLGGQFPIEFHSYQSRGNGVGFNDTGKLAKVLRHGPGTTLMRDALNPPDHVAKPIGNARTDAFRQFPNTGQAHDVGIVVHAELREFAAPVGRDVHLFDAFPFPHL
jgi:hypothetical protein